MIAGVLLDEIEHFSEKYQISFQFWGPDNNNVYISKDHVELTSFGGRETINDILIVTLEYLRRINGIKKEINPNF